MFVKYEILNMTRVWDKEKSEFPIGIDPRSSEHREGALSTELRELTESKVILLSSYVTGVLHIARISTAECIMSSDK